MADPEGFPPLRQNYFIFMNFQENVIKNQVKSTKLNPLCKFYPPPPPPPPPCSLADSHECEEEDWVSQEKGSYNH